jgi:hypothetical protein
VRQALIRGLLATAFVVSIVACSAQVQVSAKPLVHPARQHAELTGQCTMGSIPTGQGSEFSSGPPRNQVIGGTNYYPVIGYQLTLTNKSTMTADINGWVIAFYDSSGQELGSDQQVIGDEFLTRGQSLTWTRYAPDDTDGNSQNFGDDQSIPADGSAASCQIAQWTHP